MVKWILLLFPLASLAAPLGLKKLNIQSGMHLDYVDGEDIDARIFGYRLNIDLSDDFSEDVDLFFSASAILETGSNEVVSTESEFAPIETIVLNEGGIDFHPIDLLRFKVGALSGREYNSPLLITNSPAIGAQQTLDLGLVYFKALQAIPNNNRLARRTGTLDNGTPSFYLETLGFKWEDYIKLEISHFLYRDLAPNIATNSQQFGNSITGTGEAARFNYGFDGYNARLDTLLKFGQSRLGLYGQYIVNNKAPENRNEGYLGGFLYGFGSFEINLESFRNETDTAPAFYNSKYYGHNNMQGGSVAIISRNRSYDFQIQYYNFNPIEDNANQFETDILVANLYLNYEL